MKQDDLSTVMQNEAIEACRALTTADANADPGALQRAAVVLLGALEADDTDLKHFESGQQFRVTFYQDTACEAAEGAVILQSVGATPVAVKVEHVGTAAAPTTNIARMGAENEPADNTRTGGEIANDIDPDRHRETPADDGTVAEAEGDAAA